MALSININELIHGSTVEWERIESREGTKSGLGSDQVGLIQKIVTIATSISPTSMSERYSSRKPYALHR